MDLSLRIEAHALQNAVRYGTAITGKVIPKILGEFPTQKARMKELKQEIDAIVEQVNAVPEAERLPRLESIAPDLLEKKERKREFPELPNAVDGKVVTRLPPEPSKYNHLGHALTFIINAVYAKKYKGRLLLKFEDTNPEKVSQEFVDSMLEDIQGYLGIEPDETVYVSDHMDMLIAHAVTLIEKRAAYMCSCPREEMSAKRRSGEECACRANSTARNLEEWQKFQDGAYPNGEWILRFMGEMDSKNTVLRDPVLFRTVQAAHFRQGTKYHVWPMYDFYSPITDAFFGVTHVLRSNEFDLRVALHTQIKDVLGLAQQEIVHYGRFNIAGATTKGREIRELIETGEYLGWDDPRLVTLKALKRRGIQRAAYWELAQELGLSPYQVNLDFSKLAAINRRIVDPLAKRMSFLAAPVEIAVAGAPRETVELHLHPEKKEGGRTIAVNGTYLLESKDVAQLRDGEFRLKDHLTIEKQGDSYVAKGKEMPARKGFTNLNWLAKGETVPVVIVMPDATRLEGVAEKSVATLLVDEVIQFERFGFCRFDGKDDETFVFWYTHD